MCGTSNVVIDSTGKYRLEGCDEPVFVEHGEGGKWYVNVPQWVADKHHADKVRTHRTYRSDGVHVGDGSAIDFLPHIIGKWIEPASPAPLCPITGPGRYRMRNGKEAVIDLIQNGKSYPAWSSGLSLSWKLSGEYHFGLSNYDIIARIDEPWKPQVGQYAKTRDGRKAKVEFAVPEPEGPLHALGGWIEGVRGAFAWSLDGESCLPKRHPEYSLTGPWIDPPTASDGSAAV